jgi:scyllo-inositol 2-dehydrogenase (NADP+)
VLVSDAVRVGLVGYGMAGRQFHSPLLRATEGLTVTHVVTGNPERAAAASQELGARVVATYAELLAASDDLDLVVLASPTQLHAAHATAAVDRGLAVVVDKPLATSHADAATVVPEPALGLGPPHCAAAARRGRVGRGRAL